MDRPRLHAALACMAVALLAGCASKPADGGASVTAAPPPALEVGDWWTHETSGAGMSLRSVVEVMALEEHAGAPAYRMEGAVDWALGESTTHVESTSWIRVSDHASLRSVGKASLSFGGQDSNDTSNATSTTTYEPPCLSLRWGQPVGATWKSTCTSTREDGNGNETGTVTTTYTVEKRETITVRAGTFDSLRIRVEADGLTSTQWVAQKACGVVKAKATQDGQAVTTELVSYKCQGGRSGR